MIFLNMSQSFFLIKTYLIRLLKFGKSTILNLVNSLIAATALIHNLEIYTRNLSDFERVKKLKCIDPIR